MVLLIFSTKNTNHSKYFLRFITWLMPLLLTFKSYVFSAKIQFVFLNCFETQIFQKYFLNFLKMYEIETSQKTGSLSLQQIQGNIFS